MKNIIKLPAGLVLAAMLISLSGCAGGSKNVSSSSTSQKRVSSATASAASSSVSSSSSSSVTTSGGFSLPYNSVTIFNPLLPETQSDMVLWSLMYDCLAEPDTNYNPVKRLASSISNSGRTVTVQLKSGVDFTDGTSLSASDVAYSYNLARRNTKSPYNARLYNIRGVTPSGNLTVTLTLRNPDPLIANMLDVPIIKNGTGVSNNAVGTGRYKYYKSGINAKLVLNNDWYGGGTSAFKTIPLINIPKDNAVMTTLSIGEINYVYSDNGSGASATPTNTETTPVNLNQLVFIGVNAHRAHLSNAHFRRALSLSIDRSLLASQTYSSHAAGCILPFNPSWSELSKPTAKELSSDFTKETAEMKLAGGTGNTSLTLLVNSDNSVRTAAARYVASCFSKTGITVKVHAVSFGTYAALIKQKNFDMYIGEIKLANDMDISPLLASNGSASYGAILSSASFVSFLNWRAGNGNIKSVANTFKSEMPFIPLCYRMGTISHTIGLSGVTATDGNIFYDIEKWSHS